MKKIFYQGKEYNKKNWIAYLYNFKKLDNGYCLREYHKNFNNEEISKSFKENIKIFTFSRLIFPCALFLLLFLVTIVFGVLFENKGNFTMQEYYSVKVYLIFLSSFFLFVSLMLFFKIVIKKEKCYIGKKYNKNQIYYINKFEEKEILEAIDNFYKR